MYLILTVTLMTLLRFNSVSGVNKCCAINEQLKIDKTCVPIHENETDENWWIPNSVQTPLQQEKYYYNHTQINNNNKCNNKNYKNFVFTHNVDLGLLLDGTMIIDDFPYGPDSYCVDRFYAGNDIYAHIILLCPDCGGKNVCIRKCCHPGFILRFPNILETGKCVHNDSLRWLPNTEGNNYYFEYGYPICKDNMGMYLITTDPNNRIDYTIYNNGSAVWQESDPITSGEYCGEMTEIDGLIVDNLFTCKIKNKSALENKRQLYGIFFVIGAICLLITLVIQAKFPEKRKGIHSRTLSAHIITLFIAYVILAVASFGTSPSNKFACVFLALLIQFTFLSSFFWLNVMCIDISLTFSGYRIPHGNNILSTGYKTFTHYSIYVWLSCLIISAITLIVEFLVNMDSSRFKPNFGLKKCWFTFWESAMVFFYLPMAILLLMNLFLFIYTTTRIIKARKETAIVLRNSENNRERKNQKINEQRFSLYLKLFSLMGITWIFEIISWASNSDTWYVTDMINALRGVTILIIFCCKPDVVKHLKIKVSGFCGKATNFRQHKQETHSSLESSQKTVSFNVVHVPLSEHTSSL